MGNYEQLKQSVSEVIKKNGNNEITGEVMQNILLTIISVVGHGANFIGIATPTTIPGTPDAPVFYIATDSGQYVNFGITIDNNGAYLLYNTESGWKYVSIIEVSQEFGSSTTATVSQQAITAKINRMFDFTDIFESVDVIGSMLETLLVQTYVGLLGANGKLFTNFTNYSASDFVEIDFSKNYYFIPNAAISDSFSHIAFYKADKTVLYTITGSVIPVTSRNRPYKLMIPIGASYFRVSASINNVILFQCDKRKSYDNMIFDYVTKNIVAGGINLFDARHILRNSYLDPTTGVIHSRNNYMVSDFINISAFANFSTNLKRAEDSYALYDKDKTLLSFGSTVDTTLIPTNGASYVRISSNSYNSVLSAAMVCGNNLPSIYVPYNMVDNNNKYDINSKQYWTQLECPIFKNSNIIPTSFVDGIFGSVYPNFETSDFIPVNSNGSIHYYYATSTYGAGLSKIVFYDKDKNILGSVNGAALSSYKNVLLRINYPNGCEYVKYARQKGKDDDGIYICPYTSFEDAVKSVISTTPKEYVLWVGTSIPEGATYPQVSCENNGYNCINNSYGQSRLCFTSNPASVSSYSGRELTATVQELKDLYQSHIGIEISQSEFNQWLDKSYERSVLPFIRGESLIVTDGTTNVPDGIINPNNIKVSAIVIDHGYNDYNNVNSLMEDPNSIDWESLSRDNFVGAFNYLINKIQEINPTLKVVVGGYFNYTLESSNKPLGKNLCDLQSLISEKYNMELLDVWNFSQISWSKFISGTSNYMDEFNTKYGTSYVVPPYGMDAEGNIRGQFVYCPDGIHPHSDKTGNCNKRLNAVYSKLLNNIV